MFTSFSQDQKRHYLVCFKTWLAEDQLNNEVIDQFWRRREEVSELSCSVEFQHNHTFVLPSRILSKFRILYFFCLSTDFGKFGNSCFNLLEVIQREGLYGWRTDFVSLHFQLFLTLMQHYGKISRYRKNKPSNPQFGYT